MSNKKKVLFVANHKGFSKFNEPYMQWFKQHGWQVDNASPGIMVDCVDNHYDITIQRSPLSLDNYKAYRQLKKLIDDNNYDIVHLHTPMGAFIGRLSSAAARKNGTKVIYTAHGFHFYKGAPLKNWLVYYAIEFLQKNMVDAIVTINQEDYEIACEKKFADGKVYKIDGVGVNLEKFKPTDLDTKNKIRESLGIDKDRFVMLYIGQFNARKNHRWILQQLPRLVEVIPQIMLVCIGGGPTEKLNKEYVDQNNLNHRVKFLGYRNNVSELCALADIHVSSSLQEGLAINNIEAMAIGCPLVISDIRGHRDVCVDARNGFLFDLNSPDTFIDAVRRLATNPDLFATISKTNVKDANRFSVEREVEVMAQIYKTLM